MNIANRSPVAKDWQWRKFGECAEFINGRAYSQDELLDSGTPVLRIQNLNGGDRWYYSDLALPEDKYCNAGDLLFAWSASFGPYKFSGPKSIFHYHIWRVVPGPELDKAFAFRLLEWVTAAIRSAAHGVAMLHMTKAGMEAWPIALPPLPEQRRIAEVLDRAEALRAKRRVALAQLDTLTQSIFLDLFGDPIANPKRWKVEELGSFAERITKGESPKWQGFEYQDDGALFVTSENVRLGAIDLSAPKFVPLEFNSKLSRSELRPGDLLVNLVGASIGRSCIFPGYNRPANINQAVAVVTIDKSRLDHVFLSGLLVSEHGQQLLLNNRVEGARANISLTDLRELRVPVPPVPLQHEFARRVAAVDKLKSAHRASLAKLDALFASLQHRAFRGEL
jgi:type I restriction enzyme S subunit